MMSFSALLANLILPWNLALVCLFLGLALALLRWRKTAAFISCAGVLWVLFWSLPAASLWAGAWLEHRYPWQPAESYAPTQAIVVLGGNTANGRTNWFEPHDPEHTWVRTDTAAQLYHAHKAPLVIASGAALDGGISEAHWMAAALQQDGVPEHALLLENHSLTTRQNALFTTDLLRQLGIGTFFLVTSSLHMPRAMASFQKLGLNPVPAPSPPQITRPAHRDFSLWQPDWRSLQASRSIIKEYLGLLVYWLRGWA